MGTVTHSSLSEIIFGGTCEKVVRKSYCPVLTVKTHRDESAGTSREFKINTVLVPTDLSELSLYSLRYGVAFAQKYGALLILYNVNDLRERIAIDSYALEAVESGISEITKHSKKMLNNIAKENVPDDVKVETVCEEGIATESIIEYTETHGVDLVIMSTHGRTGLRHALFGSAVEEVVRKCPCPVLTVRQPGHDFVMI